MAIEVLKPGLQTTVQDWPGRKGHYGAGFPPCGPIDSWSFRLANLLVGNEAGAAALECQFIGPTLRFRRRAVVAICGADMRPILDERPLDRWCSHEVEENQVLTLSSAIAGARTYVAVSGGIDVPEFLGSRATFLIGGGGRSRWRSAQGGLGSSRGARAADTQRDCARGDSTEAVHGQALGDRGDRRAAR